MKPKQKSILGKNGKSIQVNTFVVFGWNVIQHIFEMGAQLITVTSHPIPRHLSPNRGLYVRGRASVVDDESTSYEDRVPGTYSGSRPDQPVGTTTMTALEETEMWCFNWTHNRGTLPDVSPITLVKGDTAAIVKGQNVFIIIGSVGDLVGPCEWVPEEETKISGPFYGFIISEAK